MSTLQRKRAAKKYSLAYTSDFHRKSKHMWTAEQTELPRGNGLRFTLQRDAQPATFADVIRAWREEEAFRTFFNALLAAVPYTAFCWETPGVTSATVMSETAGQLFECVALDSPGLDRRVDTDAFAEHFASEASVVSFKNLSGDATMVVPCPLTGDAAYGHLAAFVRRAPAAQQQALWQQVGETLQQRLSKKPVWLSTAGAGVSWLHVRLDDRPKYYGHDAYRQLPS
jgi:hypothetical protein